MSPSSTPPPARAPGAPTCPRCGSALASQTDLCPRCALERAAPPPTRAQRAPAATPQQLAGRIPGYEVLALIGEGGMGAVYRARQTKLDRTVALKLLSPELTRDAAVRERFAREAQALAKLAHPHIVGVHDYGEVELEPGTTLCYLAMELVEGANLRDVLREGKLAPAQALALVPPLCAALQYAHDRGIVHRDIKPENILLDAHAAPKIADFGLAKLAEFDAGLTSTGALLGTPKYMAPEQIEHPARVDHRADIYALGVVLYEMLTGELPLGRFEVPSRKVHVDVHLDEVVLKALEKAPERRYQQASEMKQRVEEVGDAAPAAPTRQGYVQFTWTRGTGTAAVCLLCWSIFSLLPWTSIYAYPTPAGDVFQTVNAWQLLPSIASVSLALAACVLAALRVATRGVPFGWVLASYVLALLAHAWVVLNAATSSGVQLAFGAYVSALPFVLLGGAVWHLRRDEHAGLGSSFVHGGLRGAR
ncbi:MAG: serine/threonine protein kinase [Planctomycetota bacterium]|nr:MAG: serine/threonine protein kinase [Planctomycetota bacterium]